MVTRKHDQRKVIIIVFNLDDIARRNVQPLIVIRATPLGATVVRKRVCVCWLSDLPTGLNILKAKLVLTVVAQLPLYASEYVEYTINTKWLYLNDAGCERFRMQCTEGISIVRRTCPIIKIKLSSSPTRPDSHRLMYSGSREI